VNNPVSNGSAWFVKWCRENPLALLLLFAIVGVLVCQFGLLHLFVDRTETTVQWATKAWNPEQDQEHSWLVPFIVLGLVWYHWEEVLKAPKGSSPLGLGIVGAGILFFLFSVRCLEPRVALISLPFLLFGSILFVWGKTVARILLFPCAFLIFLIPFGAIQQATFNLQFIITDVVWAVANLFGMHVQKLGTTLFSADNSYHFEVAGGCSGIRSITAITMLSTVYAHLVYKDFWKKAVLVAFSAVFAIIGNIGRIFTIIIVAKLFNADIASGPWHEWSGYIIFPFAIFAMIGLGSFLNHKRWDHLVQPVIAGTPGHKGDAPEGDVHYDY
jgi:exosortase